ncbi:uncharacterized protein DUF4440 [Saccharopolyspora erythraea NRRL 2338]|nr:nuclear transport factor 2 family protein [Saccharopolyspora erythraea]EQD85200.1 hypothetical protein N599_16240 [Saccharopolyspora erythraea D]PFG96092.1 uncharacterized protein DUF4440 [Saccharopolyspora erythraea NRRL 2338]QRK92633.1 nuclear transport factor 2 family protein [Saccharopolyspora erythraea]
MTSPPSPHASDDAVANEVVAVADDWAVAIVSNDAARIGAFMAEDWVVVSESGVSSKADFLALVDSGDLRHSAMSRVGAASVRVHGATAVYAARVTSTAHYRGRRFDADEWTTDVFVRHEGRWLCVHSHITPAAQDG